ncbi:hypothetical protein OG401_23485 [Kitasatospora purpeofusca]|uniref:hypothetical protein n=1 Tax=Kitasatospora purpeofusca TaxID=67352 RepID=UPI00225A003A|nr:hypothetical protein [Kitasatospora purpeofusca]MCX4687231.1 hypothetical protein [Kitasatospora purpeofusca]
MTTALPPLATLAQLAAWMQRTPAELPEGAALVLDVASAVVRSEARSDFTRRVTTATFSPRDGWITLPLRPVVRVDAVTVAGGAVEPYGWLLAGDRLRVMQHPYTPALITYTSGYGAVPGDVLAVVLTLAARILNNPADLRQEAVGGVSVTYAAETIGASLAPAERDQLARYRRRAAMVSLE